MKKFNYPGAWYVMDWNEWMRKSSAICVPFPMCVCVCGGGGGGEREREVSIEEMQG